MFINRMIEKYRYRTLYKKGIFIAEHVEIIKPVVLGEYCMIAHHASVNNCDVDAYTSIGRYSKIRDASIGKFCSISWDVTIGAVSHPYDHLTTHSFPYNAQFDLCVSNTERNSEKTIIGHDVWIGANAVILSGVKIGDGAVIGAGAVVSHNVEPYSIVGGVPAKLIKYRFAPELINTISELKWWEWSERKLKQFNPLFTEKLTIELLNNVKH